MQYAPSYYFLHNASAANIATNPNFAGEFEIRTQRGNITVQGESNITACDLDCAAPCIPQQLSVEFAEADYGDCKACPIAVGFTITRERQPDYDVSDYTYITNSLSLIYPQPAAGGTVAGAVIAQYFADLINNSRAQADLHDYWGITATVAGAVLTLLIPCHQSVALFQLPDTGGYTPTFATVAAGQAAKWTIPQMRRLFQKNVNEIPGQDPDLSWFENCESVCVLTIEGCYQQCANINLERSNAVHLHAAGTKVKYVIFLNSNAPGYAAFIAALAAALTTAASCSGLTPEQGSNVPFASATAAAWAAGDGLDISARGFTYPGMFQLTNGTVTLTVTAANGTALAAAIQGDTSTSITATFNDPELDITNFGTSIITLRQIG